MWHRHTYHLTLPPATSTSTTQGGGGGPPFAPPLLLPLTSLSGEGGEEGGAFFFRLSQATLTGVPSVVSGVRVGGEEGKGEGFSWAFSFPCTPSSAAIKGQVACKVRVGDGGAREVEVLVNLRAQKE